MKWVGVERCNKPISGGPTLAGLPGGVAGDLLRLYPVKSNDEYPMVGIRTPNLDDPVLVCRPLPKKVRIYIRTILEKKMSLLSFFIVKNIDMFFLLELEYLRAGF